MANNRRDSGIPVWVIVCAWLVYPPVGIILTIIKCLPSIAEIFSNRQNTNTSGTTVHYSSTQRTQSESTTTHYASTYQKPNMNQTYYQPKGTINTQQTVQQNHQVSYSAPAAENKPKKKKGKDFGAMKIISFVLLGLAAIILISGIPDMFTFSWISDVLPPALLFGVFGGGLLYGSNIIKKRETRLSTIRLLIGNRESAALAKIAGACGTTLKQVRKDVQYLIDHGEYGAEAYIDNATDNFMRTPNAVAEDPVAFDYTVLYGDKLKKKKKDDKSDNSSESSDVITDDFSINTDNEDYKQIVREIRRLNDEIKDPAVSERIFKIEAHTKNIFEYVSAHPGSQSKIRTFLNYYLPTTLKLLESYSQIEKVGVAGENMKKSKENIENTLDMLCTGFQLQIDDLFKSESIDISSDISVLEAMMNKDGLSGKSDFQTSPKADAGYTDELTGFGGMAAQAPADK